MLLQPSYGDLSDKLSNISLAYIGDGVFELMVREYLITHFNIPGGQLHKLATDIVNAQSQSDGANAILHLLTNEETQVYMRGRNAKLSGNKKNNPVAHCRASGIETLFGYLYLKGNIERLNELIMIILDNNKNIELNNLK